MDNISGKIIIKINDKEYLIDSTSDFKLINSKIIDILEEIYKKKLSDSNNLYKIFYFDEDNDKIFIKTQEDYNYFINISSTLILEIDENAIIKIKSTDEIPELQKDSPSDNELILLEKIKELTKINENLKKEKDLYSEMSQIYKDKIDLLEEDQKLKNEKEQSIMKELENEKKEKNDIIDQLEEAQKLNESMSLIINNNTITINDKDNVNDNAKDILLNNLKEEKTILEKQLNKEREKIDFFEKIYSDDNNKLKQKLNYLQNEINSQKQQILKNQDILIKKEVEKGINDFINKSKIDLEKKENELNKIKNNYENKINTIREECYQEIEDKLSKIYEEKIKQIYESAINNSKMLCENIISENQQQFEEEEKKRNQLISSNLLYKSNNNNNNFSKISQCKTIHKYISCSECNICPIIGYRYKCLECPDYNLCENCEKIVNHEHNFVKYFTEENKTLKAYDNKYSYQCLSSKLSVSINEGDKTANLNIILKNNGSLKWTDQTLLINGKDSQILLNYVKLKPLRPNEQDLFEITFDELDKLPAKTYTSILLFSVDEKIYGEPIKAEINILKN